MFGLVLRLVHNMSKVPLIPIANLQQQTTATSVINANAVTTTTGFDNPLSRDGTSPNAMGSNLDMNNFQVLNLPAPATINSPVRLVDVPSATGVPISSVPPTGTSGAVVPFLNGNNTWSGTNTYSNSIVYNPTPSYTLASGLLSAPVLMTLNSASQTITNGNTFSGFRFSQSDGSTPIFTESTGSSVTIAAGMYSFIQGAGTNANLSVYGGTFHAYQSGAGTARGIHIGGHGVTGATGSVSGAALQLIPVVTNSSAYGTFCSLATSGVNNTNVIAHDIETSGDSYNVGILGGGVNPLPIINSFIQWNDSVNSAAGALFLRVFNPSSVNVFQVTKAGDLTANSATATSLISGTAANGITLSSSAVARNNSAGSLSFTAGSGAGNTIALTTAGVARVTISDSVTNIVNILQLTGVTFAGLPGSPVTGEIAYVTDASAAPGSWAANVTAGGSTNKVLVWYNGTNWTAIGK